MHITALVAIPDCEQLCVCVYVCMDDIMIEILHEVPLFF